MLHPKQFKVNQVWIAFRVNDSLIYIADEPYDIYFLLDAASTYMLGHLACKTAGEGPDLSAVEDLFQEAASHKKQFPHELIIPEDFVPREQFKTICDSYGIRVREVPEGELSLILGEIKESFEQSFFGPGKQ
ncbi:MAG: hypothetical protein ACLFRL_03870 [Desulfohalobiaceae bacterium]